MARTANGSPASAYDQATGVSTALVMLFVVAANLRTGLIGVGPLLPDMSDDLSLSNTNASLLVAIPPLMMGICAIPGGRLADRRGPRPTITLGLAIVALAGGLRAVVPEFPALVLLTVAFGAGIGITQPALPRMCRALIPRRMGVATGVYAGGFFTGAVLAAFLTGPIFLTGNDVSDWRLPLAVWGALAGLALAAWLLALSKWRSTDLRPSVIARATSALPEAVPWSPWRDRQTWIVAAIFAGQGLAYYLLVAWLPSVYEDLAIDATESALLFAVFNLATFPAMVGLPIVSDRIDSRRIPAALAAIVFLAGSLGLAIDPAGQPWRWLWPVLAGFGLAGLFGMGLLMPADTARSGKTGQTAGMVLGIGYVASGLGPIIGGAIQDITGSFESALAILPVIAIGMVALSWVVPRPAAAHRIERPASADPLPSQPPPAS